MTKCPQCGYVEPTQNRFQSNTMNRYVNKSNPKEVSVFNHGDDTITVKGVTWIKESVLIAQKEAEVKKTVTPAPVQPPIKPSVPVKPIVQPPVKPAEVPKTPILPAAAPVAASEPEVTLPTVQQP